MVLSPVDRFERLIAATFLSIVIPAFNEEARIIPTLETVVGYLSRQSYSWEVVLVDDGSLDGTAALVNRWAANSKRVRVEMLPHGGKGWAVRHGMLVSNGEYRFMCDADLAMPIEWLPAFLCRMSEGYDIVIGSRQVTGARRVGEPVVRHIMGRVFNCLVQRLAIRAFQDTQCGFKCFRGDVAEQLFRLQQIKGWAFDVEVLYLALRMGLRVLEMPIEWHYQQESKVRPSVDSFRMIRDTSLVRWYDLRGQYGPKEERMKSTGGCD